MMNMDNCCIQWAAFKLWRSIAAGADAAEAIAAAGVLFDNFLFRMEVSRGKKRLCPAEEFVALCGGDIAIATELATLHRDYVVAALALNVAARGAKANVVSFGDVAEAYVAKQLAPTGLVDVAGRFPHPEALLSLKGDVQAKIESGAFFNAPTKRVTYVAADSTAAAIARICGFVVVVTFHVDLFEGHGDVLGELAKLRSKRGKDVWATLSDEEYAARCWSNLPEKERRAWCSAIRKGVAAMAAEAKAKLAATRRANGKAQFAEGKTNTTGLVKKGDKHTAAAKKKMSAAQSKPDAKRIFCPGCCGYSVPVAVGGLMRVHFGLASLPVTSNRCVPVEENADGEPCNGLQVARNAVAYGYAPALPATFTRAGDLKTGADRLKSWADWSK